MSRLFLTITALAAVAVAGCSYGQLSWRQKAAAVLGGLGIEEADSGYRQEYESVCRTFARGDELLRGGNSDRADDYFRLALLKGDLLEKKRAERKALRVEEEQLRSQRDQLAMAAVQDAQSRNAHPAADDPKQHHGAEKHPQHNNRALPTLHIVKRGETLPQIAAHSDVYNDHRLWIVLYRSNRDQIRDPYHLWPGQTLRIPRNLSREEIAEALRYSSGKPL
jgi:LysM domain